MRENSGSFKKNANKGENEKAPDYKGKVNVAGVEYWLAGWVKDADDGKWVSLSFDPVEKKEAPTKSQRNAYAAAQDGDDLIPF